MNLAVAGLLFAGTTAAQTPPPAYEDKYCSGCHAVDQKMVGPALKDVATKYRNQPDAKTYLAQKIRNGGVGVWGNIPMPAADLTDSELKSLVDWITSLK